MKKIAFLFLTIKDINFPNIWDAYFKNNKNKYNIYIHPKYSDQVNWHPENIINNLVETKWGFITRAYIELFKEALKDKDNYKFITMSEACIPIKSFDIFYKDVTDDPRSWIKIMKLTKYDLQFRLKNESKNIIHHYARFCLNRHHIKKILIKKNTLDFFHNMHVGDEFFLSVLYPLKNYRNFDVIYDDWEYTENLKTNIKNKIKKLYEEQELNKNINNTIKIRILKDKFNCIAGHPKTIINVEEDLTKIKNSKSYFYRKFSQDSNIEKYIYDII
jgi:hypothetical protein